MSASDRALMQALAEAVGGTAPPTGLVARCEGLLDWMNVDAELAELLEQPMLEAAGTRGAGDAVDLLEFSVADGSCVVEVTPSAEALRGQVLGAEAREITVREADGDGQTSPIDEHGRFEISNPPSGGIRLELDVDGRRIHTDWFVI
jgi:hypothetical protein